MARVHWDHVTRATRPGVVTCFCVLNRPSVPSGQGRAGQGGRRRRSIIVDRWSKSSTQWSDRVIGLYLMVPPLILKRCENECFDCRSGLHESMRGGAKDLSSYCSLGAPCSLDRDGWMDGWMNQEGHKIPRGCRPIRRGATVSVGYSNTSPGRWSLLAVLDIWPRLRGGLRPGGQWCVAL